MRSWSILFVAAFYAGCASDTTSTERPKGAGGSDTGSSTTTSSGTPTGSTSGNTTSTSTGNPSGTSSTTSATSGAGGASTTSGSPTGSGGTTSGTAGSTGATGGKAGSGGSSGSGGAPKDASVETGPPPPPPDPGPLSGGGAGCNDVDPVHQGSATFYDVGPTSAVNCGYDLTAIPQPTGATQPPYYWLAINGERYAASKACGACIQASGPSGKKNFIVVDSCKIENNNPLCTTEHLDLSREGFNALGGNGRIDSMPWQFVPCDVKNDVGVFTQANSNTFYSTIGIRNHRYRIDKVELVTGTSRVALMRRDDNFFVIDSTTPAGSAGLALGPFRLRITDIYGHWIENKITLSKGQSVGMTLQFPACPAGGGNDGGP